jgi:hypothetical protein
MAVTKMLSAHTDLTRNDQNRSVFGQIFVKETLEKAWNPGLTAFPI